MVRMFHRCYALVAAVLLIVSVQAASIGAPQVSRDESVMHMIGTEGTNDDSDTPNIQEIAPRDARFNSGRDKGVVSDLVDEDGLTSSRRLAERARQLIAEGFGGDPAPLPERRTVDNVGATQELGSDSANSHAESTGPFRIGLPAGDLTGDGRPDVIVQSFNVSGGVVGLTAIDQAGEVLWSREFTVQEHYYDAFPVPAGDLDGDGAHEMLVVSLRLPDQEQSGGCIVVACVFAGNLDFEWTFEVVSGPDGRTLWTQSTTGQTRAVTALWLAPFTATGASIVHGENLLMLAARAGAEGPWPEDELGPAILIESVDVTVLSASASPGLLAYADAEQELFVFSTTYALHDGATGDVRLRGVLGPSIDLPVALPAGDLTADGAVDLFLVEPQNVFGPVVCLLVVVALPCVDAGRNTGFKITAQDGISGDSLWETDRGDGTARRAHPLVMGDHSGDGVEDILVVRLDDLSERAEIALLAVDGATGENLWADEASGTGTIVEVFGDADGDNRDDILVFGVDDDETVRLRALAGRDADLLWDNRIATDSDFLFTPLVSPAGDLDNDSVDDVIVDASGVACEESSNGFFCKVAVEIVAIAGVDGDILWRANQTVLPAGALDDEPGDDVVTTDSEQRCGGRRTVTALNGLTLSPIWRRSEVTVGASTARLFAPQGTLDAHPSDDILYSLNDKSGEGTWRSSVRPLSGDSGAVLWTFGDSFGLRPCEPLPQDDVGSGTDAPNSGTDPLMLTPGSYNGTLDPDFTDVEDWYAVDLNAGQRVGINVTTSDGDFEIALYGPDDALLATSESADIDDEPRPDDQRVVADALTSGTHAIRVFADSGRGNYSLVLEVEQGPAAYVETFVMKGDIDCAAVATSIISTNDLCGGFAPELEPSPHGFPFSIGPNASAVHVEVHWSQEDAISGADRLAYFWAGYGSEIQGAEGSSPIVHDQRLGALVPWYLLGRNGSLGIRVPTTATGPVVLEQPFTLCVAVMYGGAGLPADYACGA